MNTSLFQKIMRIVLGGMMVLAGIGHLTFQREEFQAQVPRWLPTSPEFMDFVVIASGVVEIGLGPLLRELDDLIKEAATIKELLCIHGAHESRLDHIHLSACWTSIARLVRQRLAERRWLQSNAD